MKHLCSLLLMSCLTLLSACVNDNEPSGPSLSVGDPLPSFSVVMNDGETVSNISLLGKTSVIIFFNTACPDCQKELPVVQQLWEIYEDDPNIKIIAIAREENEKKISDYWNQNNLTIPWSPQESREVFSLFAPSIIPRIYISDSQTIIRDIFTDNPLPSLETLLTSLESI
ncbi:MAG: TlpA family protein disulfide reductase [Muribaculaceae bacterium]|nr:TlpA family protein disulfide reductase [Muribaculaceae bacterium]